MDRAHRGGPWTGVHVLYTSVQYYYSSYTCITNNNTMKVNMIFVVHHGLFILL